uniref:Uncharacterized protein n=1 Tax=Anguilla anguilla TaxID=7936 RepID=A0A0E9UXR8_ANGAN
MLRCRCFDTDTDTDIDAMQTIFTDTNTVLRNSVDSVVTGSTMRL